MVFFALVISGCMIEETVLPSTGNVEISDELKVTFFDVGQGDATLFQTEDATILIDAGRHDRDDVVSLLESANVDTIDLFVATHPHADHIGQADKVLQTFNVEEVWMSGDVHDTRTFERTIAAISAADIDYYEPRAGEEFNIGSMEVEVLNPEELTGDFNNGSIAIRLQYDHISFIMMGDVEVENEIEILKRGHQLKANILRLGHHGSSTSTSKELLDAVNPEVAIYSAGEDNEYGHPHREVVSLIESRNIDFYGTDKNGHIVVTTNGETYEVVTEYDNEVATSSCVDLNKASVDELEQIVHLGEERAEEVMKLRPITAANQLTDINGIGDGRLADIIAEGKACLDGVVLR